MRAREALEPGDSAHVYSAGDSRAACSLTRAETFARGTGKESRICASGALSLYKIRHLAISHGNMSRGVRLRNIPNIPYRNSV